MGKTNQTGRSNKKDRYVALPHYIMNTFAWQRLSVTARAAWLEFVRVHNSFNNGKIAMSERTLAKRLGVVRNTASRAIKELLTFGFIEITKASTFNIKRRAAEYRLTHIKDDITGELRHEPSKTSERPCLAATVWLAMSSKALAIVRAKTQLP
jgi:DNA-binding FadR family transcriptional regulator